MTITTIQLDRKEYKRLTLAHEKLVALENHGVDNWEYYDLALKDYRKQRAIEKCVEDTLENILQTIAEDATVEYPSCREAGPAIMFDRSVELQVEKWLYEMIKTIIVES